MASPSIQRLSGVLGRSVRQFQAVSYRNYTTVPAKPVWKPRTSPIVPTATAKVSTGTGVGNPATIESLPNTAPELKVSSEIPPPNVEPPVANGNGGDTTTDWSKSYHGLSEKAFSKEIAEILLAPVDPMDVEMKPDGLIYLPEIKYRRVLNKAFGPGAWGLAPRSETNVGPRIVSREYALVCQGRLVAISRGEQEYFDPSGIPTATEACKSNALMRCCKDLGIASELWDPRFIREFKAKYCVEVFTEHLPTKKKYKLWRRKDQPKFTYPYQE
ncbi:mitochondrial genome maintenance MGM101-domain-containing protein [Collybia nuda]|uniref:Mitochondrial genome maintenance protein MGM101 n=1 Tax=Collybia nuda TaxID=64659 RepID=A0A9P5Y3K4_9AGAR|nr:mitochondrial genome maintenance MGM101-domain-containing protein [Collybia nuda]